MPKRYIKHAGYIWELDLFSTILSRKHAYHIVRGNLRYVRIKKL